MVRIGTRPGPVIAGELSYCVEDHAFDFSEKPVGESSGSRASLLIGTIQIEVDGTTGRLLFAWGYSALQGWSSSLVPVLEGARGQAFVSAGIDLHPGMGHQVIPVSEARAIVDFGREIIRFSQVGLDPTNSFNIAPGVELLLADSELIGVQLAPSNFIELQPGQSGMQNSS